METLETPAQAPLVKPALAACPWCHEGGRAWASSHARLHPVSCEVLGGTTSVRCRPLLERKHEKWKRGDTCGCQSGVGSGPLSRPGPA